MLRVDSSKPCQIIYAIAKHDYLSYVIEPHIVQLNPNGEFSLTHQRLFSNTAKEFCEFLDETDIRLIKLLEEMEQGNVIKRYYKKPIRPFEFFSKIFNEQMFDMIRPKLEKRIAEALSLLCGKQVYQMSKEGYPGERKLQLATEAASVLFHFRRSEQEIRYFPTIKYQGMRIEFMFKNAEIICNHPAWMLLDDTLYYFDKEIEGKKLQPFLNKRFIAIPKSSEQSYFEKFVAPLIEKHNVYAEGFTINTEKYDACPVLKPIYIEGGTSQLQLSFKYAGYVFPYGDGRHISVRMEKTGDDYLFHRIKRSTTWEKGKMHQLEQMGLKIASSLFQNLEVAGHDEDDDRSFSVFEWLNQHHDQLIEQGFELEQPEGQKRYVFGSSKIELEVTENNDWFDINAMVSFGPYRIPFIQLKNHILNHKKEFTLPSGEIAVIPEKWFSQYGNLLHFTEGSNELKLRRHHIGLVTDLAEGEMASVTMTRKLQKLTNFDELEDAPMPVNFEGNLRPYQKAGYNWFHFLKQYHFGGCLADDMGLGKTIQTLSLLQKHKEDTEEAGGKATSLVIMPTSLIYNWLNEARKFAPQLKLMVHTGTMRYRSAEVFANYDVVITTYGISRIDIEMFKGFFFDYVILDESQNIKNPSSKSYQAVKQLKSRFKLILSGTPVENSVNDLWTQMSFINPGLLGAQQFFQNEFVAPIEKKKDEDKARKLQALIKPFVLRRTKEQVATELPPKTENLFYCQMTEEQSSVYEEVKSEYRNELLKSLEDGTFAKTQIQVLQGLIKLRQIANHPIMIDKDYEGDSGKFEDVVHTLGNVLDGGHKVLIFSQFVKQLSIYREHFERVGIPYVYLDGATQNRGDVVKQFQEDEKTRVFLISIKAGGVGLNLTEADYVFILDPWWNPAVEQQAIDRTHRIGQTKNVFIYKFITKDSVEEKILALQQRKLSLSRALITTEESFIKSLTADDIKEILG
ncbi:DEAD/DEAH box helicase [Mucilaginibacter rubeus]|uniref:DEAD/DEAH box helicase n=1 Tax=Mucilaginibacter rubeus TaxID=2027860 RepID=A0AAE6JI84_9SPHI|nr:MULTISPECIES: DEAD/DEAH box helicase [Mucilaginibacter]QEM06267.1 DEAD/DEAH box helicase [Mucilaginibacter rubeus]QEM18850.1 DEAD/DEAH box helicase [Mucilaginibacter gossypii]QTE44608.1 DEAD/DEAH box helicase [Mucilaginibacter rubeus]QTE51206.1 DEAD/DEAH box helicase [Mucilaginibacter rubeus]QTE56293.1 DEAD/DEAH box helicase [Mucilaginibacter rubeus]